MSSQQTRYIPGANGIQLAATSYGSSQHAPVLLLHGAGQTRHSWRRAGEHLANAGWHCLTLDTRGHGESEWPDDGNYSVEVLVEDVQCVVEYLTRSSGQAPVLVGASLGGICGLLAQGESSVSLLRSLILVDITPRMDSHGVAKIVAFMRRHQAGFASMEEAVAAVAEYQSHRSQPVTRPSSDKPTDNVGGGLRKNLRLADDGRYYWHWDPRLMDHIAVLDEVIYQRLCEAARQLSLPVLLVRGQQSEIVSADAANDFLQLVPHGKYVDIANAAHMVAGDSNDVFTNAVLDFIGTERH